MFYLDKKILVYILFYMLPKNVGFSDPSEWRNICSTFLSVATPAHIVLILIVSGSEVDRRIRIIFSSQIRIRIREAKNSPKIMGNSHKSSQNFRKWKAHFCLMHVNENLIQSIIIIFWRIKLVLGKYKFFFFVFIGSGSIFLRGRSNCMDPYHFLYDPHHCFLLKRAQFSLHNFIFHVYTS